MARSGNTHCFNSKSDWQAVPSLPYLIVYANYALSGPQEYRGAEMLRIQCTQVSSE